MNLLDDCERAAQPTPAPDAEPDAPQSQDAPPRGLARPLGGEMEITKERLMAVLNDNFRDAGINITVRRYNKIFTDLGFSLDEAPPNPGLQATGATEPRNIPSADGPRA